MRALSLVLLSLVFYLLHPTLSSSVCDPAYAKLRSVTNLDEQTARNQIYINLSTDSNINNTCGLNVTCCSSTAETHFKSNIARTIQSKLFNSLNTTIKPCTQSNLQEVTAEYIVKSKNYLGNTFQFFTPLSFTKDMFDKFFNYVKNGVLNIDLCNLKTEFQEVVFTVYTTAFAEAMAKKSFNVPSSSSFTQCFNNYFKSTQSTFLNNEYKRFKERYNLFLRYLLALETANDVLEDVISHTLSSDCKDALLKLTHCSLCAGNTDTILSCPGYCENVFRGCLVDLKEFGDAYTEFFGALKSTREQLSSYDPFNAFTLFQTQMISLVMTVIGSADTIKTALENDCGATFTSKNGRRRRSLHHVAKRQTTDAANAALQETVTCADSVSTLFGQLSDSLCTGSVASSNCNCWNGATIGSYRYSVVNGDRLSQRANPELYLRSNTGLQYKDSIAKLKNITQNLKSCSSNVTNCPVKLCNLTVPRASNYNLGTRYQTFTQSGFPTPSPMNVNCTAIEVSTTSIVWSTTSTTSATSSLTMSITSIDWSRSTTTTTSSTTSSTTSATLPLTSKSSHRASSIRIISSSTRIIPSSAVHTTTISVNQITVHLQPTQIISDGDNDRSGNGVSPTCVTINLVIFLVLLSILL